MLTQHPNKLTTPSAYDFNISYDQAHSNTWDTPEVICMYRKIRLCICCLVLIMVATKKGPLEKKRKQKLPKEGTMAQTPRFSAEHRLQSRFYEPLVLLHILDRNGQQHISRCPSEDLVVPQVQLRELRRTFLGQLAYVCDYIKGGDTVTAMALEAQPYGVTFWLASNISPSAGVISFLRGILNTLQSLAISRPEQRIIVEDDIARTCIDFNLKRVKAYRDLMQKPLQKCLESLTSSEEPKDRGLAEWLKEFQGFKDNLPSLCRFSYQQRSCQYMWELQRHIGDEPAELDETESRRQAFLLTRHYIGRLGSHLKAAKILTTAGWRMPGLFENFTIQTRPSPKPPTLPPLTDQQTTLNGIINRMLPSGSKKTLPYQEALATMDAKFNILNRLKAQFQDKDFLPRVHAELNLLEYFYRERLPFVDDDWFIACSKPACYCCYHYIIFHPGGFVHPPSHGIRYLNWRAPDLVEERDLVEETDTREKNHQGDILDKMIAKIRLDALRQIEQRRGPSAWHPDSTTGITDLKQNILVGSTSDSRLPSDNDALSDDAESLNGDASTDDELSLGDDRVSNSDEMSSGLEHTSDNLGNSPHISGELNSGFCSVIHGDESSDSDGGAIL
ncbi:hypothetical protein L207DRAFT_633163 [Hyaloscypha variabilis F]|uniref:Uncharacterized protein n=1 Tax=Hyaloscypha variabilis (strain UAMH 11265 / GT02V1 / F) TaxID=1149755 RepID=A0A2J6RTL7_HYAVF|nr:hypothetical protein L207DRAFT_633163 [Hyaloscypha variabilis F]